jgi:peptide deformylase
MIYDLLPYDHPMLYEPVPEFDFGDPSVDVEQLSRDLIETMLAYNGIGLAANQVGQNVRVFVLRAEVPFVCFNPRIVHADEETIELEEGCLSFPGMVVKVSRPRHIRVRFATPSGVVTTKTFTGMSARQFQHELDHLDGKVFFDGIGRLRMERTLKSASKRGFDYVGLMKRAVS